MIPEDCQLLCIYPQHCGNQHRVEVIFDRGWYYGPNPKSFASIRVVLAWKRFRKSRLWNPMLWYCRRSSAEGRHILIYDFKWTMEKFAVMEGA